MELLDKRIEWVCDVCTWPIDDGEGGLFCDRDRALRLRERDEDLDGQEWLFNPVPWFIGHAGCAQPTWGPEQIEIASVRTVRGLMTVTADKARESWLYWTPWANVLAIGMNSFESSPVFENAEAMFNHLEEDDEDYDPGFFDLGQERGA